MKPINFYIEKIKEFNKIFEDKISSLYEQGVDLDSSSYVETSFFYHTAYKHIDNYAIAFDMNEVVLYPIEYNHVLDIPLNIPNQVEDLISYFNGLLEEDIKIAQEEIEEHKKSRLEYDKRTYLELRAKYGDRWDNE